jgi:hypothetical protein
MPREVSILRIPIDVASASVLPTFFIVWHHMGVRDYAFNAAEIV